MFIPLCWLMLVLSCLNLSAARYHVDSRAGKDENPGTAPEQAWRSLERVNQSRFDPGDQVLFRAGGTWQGQLVISSSGAPGKPIVLSSYGEGVRPRIDAAGAFEDTIVVRNAQWVELRNFEVTNLGTNAAPRRGVHIIAENAGTLTNIVVSDLFVHNVNGTQKNKDNGGIIFRTRGDRLPSRFDGLRIERNIVWRVDRSGIVAQSYHASRTRWFPSVNVVIRDNWLGDIGGDGITPWATDGCLVEHNIVQGANERAGTYNAGIWPWSTDNTFMRLNRASEVKTLMDGQGFDSDYNSRGTILEYNLSHDNEGGFLLICSPGKRNPNDNIGNVGTVARYNISRHDRARTFHISAAENTLVHHNAIYIGPGHDVQVVLFTDWSGWADGLDMRNNLIHSEGIARYGHQISRSADGSYGIAPGWGPAKNIVLDKNRYVGRHERPPENRSAGNAPEPISFEQWPGPQFDPRQVETFSRYIREHRAWMLELMEQQFGHRPPESH